MAQIEIKEKQKEWMMEGAAAAAVLLLAFLVLIKPAVEEGRALRESIRTSQKRLELFKDITLASAKLKELEASLAVFDERPLLMGKISDMASREGIDVQGVTPSTEPVGPYTRLVLEIDLKTSYFDLLSYLDAVERLSPSFTVRDISIIRSTEPVGGGRGPKPLQCKLILATLLKQKAWKP